MRTTLLLALSLCLAGVASLPAAEAGPVCATSLTGCPGLVCATFDGGRTCIGGTPECDPAECPPDS